MMPFETSAAVLKTFADLPQLLKLNEEGQTNSTGPRSVRRSADRVIHPPREALGRLRQPLTPGERMVFDAFDRHLPAGWEIYVQPHLNGLRPDFVLLNPAVGIGVFEVKDWDLDAMRYFVRKGEGGRPMLWAERDGKEFCVERNNPVSKVDLYKDDLNALYCPRLDARAGLGAITAGVIFPFADAGRVRDLLAPFLQEAPVLAKYQPISGHQEVAEGNIRAMFPESVRSSSRLMSEDLAADLRGWLVEPDFATEQREPLLLDARQEELAKTRTASGYRRIRGPAGSGKSLILAARAARLALDGKSVLVASYNITLWHYLRDLIKRGVDRPGPLGNITLTHFHHWCRNVCHAVGWSDRYDTLWQSLPKAQPARQRRLEAILEVELPALASAAMQEPGAPQYDAVLVDEGQDYRLSWWDALRKSCKLGGEVVLVADRTQDIYGTAGAWTDEAMTKSGFAGGPWVQLRTNYRLPGPALDAARNFATRFLPSSKVDLPEPSPQGDLVVEPCALRWVRSGAGKGVETCVREVVALMLQTGKGGLANADITFLADDTALGSRVVEELRDRGIRAVATYAEAHKERRRQKMGFFMGDAKVKATTLHSFKGWETRLLVIHISRASADDSHALIYATLTRLKRHAEGSWLTVVCSAPELNEYGQTWGN